MSTSSQTGTSTSPPGQEQQNLASTKKLSRVLACIQCQQRKVKCDRQSPCANCIRSRLRCVAAAAPGPRQRRRRLPDRDLLERVRYYESLLRKHNINFEQPRREPFVDEDPAIKKSPGGELSPQATPGSVQHPPLSATVSEKRNIWHAMNQRPKTQEHDDDSSDSANDDVVPHSDIKKAWDSWQSNDSMLFGVRDSFVKLSVLHPPQQIQIFRLWQVFIENVNPLLQVVHAPSLQKRILEASAHLSGIEPNLEALMFSIYSMAVQSLSDSECQATFGMSQEYLLIRYQFGCQQALLDAEFPRTTNRDCLTALYLYLVSLKPSTHIQSLSSMLAITIRLAQRMGLHIESSYSPSKCSPFEAEMRRRLWWAIVTFDGRICEAADYQGSNLDPTWDCRVPLNVNDFELRPDMKEMPKSQDLPTEAVFAVIRAHIGDYQRRSVFHLDFVNPALKTLVQKEVGPPGREVATLEAFLEEKYLRHCDETNPFHFITIWGTRAQLAKLHLIETYTEPSGPPSEHDDSAISHALNALQIDTRLLDSPLFKGYEWFNQLTFPFPAWIYVIQSVKRTPISDVAELVWSTMNDSYIARDMRSLGLDNPFYNIIIKIIMQAWEVREEAYERTGKYPDIPFMISDIRCKLNARNEHQGQDLTAATLNMNLEEPSAVTDLDYDLGAYADMLDPNFMDGMDQTYDTQQLGQDMDQIAHELLWG